MTSSSLSALFVTIWFTGLVSGDASWNISVWQTPEMTTKEGKSVSISCHIKADSHVKRIMVKWMQDNQTVVKSETINSVDLPSVNGSVFINAMLHLQSVRLNYSGMYYCTALMDLPQLGTVEYGKGTHVYVVPNTPVTPKPYIMDTVTWSVLLGLGFVLPIICIACVIHKHSKGHKRIGTRAKEALVNATRGSQCPDTCETTVVYAAINIPRDSVKSRNENCPAPTLTSVTCTEESVTYSEVHIKKGLKDKG
ncbi:uncharacterized protein LOC113107477 [Carassius auratus]|uniref:Uncharacterized protein LOC113107477 n=1 Tax=Carassius auratus TaxID=7957 RepID=A0A6P6PYG2_CARAU|nr:uncharacterized protein LOC113107477 [Carassius auratus]XP_052420311.1 uncharacterized protein LOC127964209 [Carassius gibelio]